ncbi:helix-turn-helix domain-containing protein [Escherichia coli]|uniref:AraC family transcriptional regulator n=1 Tax=Escherichia coli TaxID=562 RepID=UPI0006A0C1E9|nr:AraC family transcriptional regulator [Escherichia coli]EFA4797491.1 AraC family transcriptional regulator [Escherichia coli]EFH3313300.1 helix-turn-helix domain-containing protein [Escherichia coli]EFK3807465.1 AraC family transcriptional regulator [Escherichia coli]EGE1766619.1 AraC family transcriptional regulator [Escherichia coli]EHQ2583559.1 AraC family transcriptional regulator [Escherichia coli]
MYQRCFDNASETLFVAGKTPRLSRFAFSDDPKWESGHHVHDNETELIYVKKGIARFTIDSSLYVAHADDIVVIERGRLHAVASDVNDPATTCTCALYGFQFQGAEENQLLQPHSCPVIAAGQGKEVIKTLFNELSVILPQSKNSQTSSLWDAFAYTLAILFYLNNNYREKITLEQLSKKFRASVSYICHEFTKEYRISPINYVIQRRMTEAKWSLTNTELSQAEISWRVGYENVDHFAKLFLRHVGCSPSDYRRQFKNCFAEQEILSEFHQPVSLVG